MQLVCVEWHVMSWWLAVAQHDTSCPSEQDVRDAAAMGEDIGSKPDWFRSGTAWEEHLC